MTHLVLLITALAALSATSFTGAAPTGDTTMMFVTHNRCNVPRTFRFQGPWATVEIPTLQIEAGQSYTHYVGRERLSLAWFFGEVDSDRYDEAEMSMSGGIAYYDTSFIQSKTGRAFHISPVMADGLSETEDCATSGCDANADAATCPRVYWGDKVPVRDYSCRFEQIKSFNMYLC